MKKRILIFALSLCLVLHGIPVYAADGAENAGLQQSLDRSAAVGYVTMYGEAFLFSQEESPAALPGVEALWVNKADGMMYYAETGDNGRYGVQIPQGTYLVQCTYKDQCPNWEVITVCWNEKSAEGLAD